ncbi:MAG: METTL5 family protein [Thermoplasmataceae archaeon]
MYTKKQLEIKLSHLELSENLNSNLEQYPTDSGNAAWVVFKAALDGNVTGKNVIDLGTGNGIFAIGASLMGASSVYAFDADSSQIAVARGNAKGLNIVFETKDVMLVHGHYDTAFMNPPFGSVSPHADTPFLSKALEVADWIYSIHNARTSEFVKSFYEERGEIIYSEFISLRMPHLYDYHTREVQNIPAIFYCVRSSK